MAYNKQQFFLVLTVFLMVLFSSCAQQSRLKECRQNKKNAAIQRCENFVTTLIKERAEELAFVKKVIEGECFDQEEYIRELVLTKHNFYYKTHWLARLLEQLSRFPFVRYGVALQHDRQALDVIVQSNCFNTKNVQEQAIELARDLATFSYFILTNIDYKRDIKKYKYEQDLKYKAQQISYIMQVVL